MSLARQHYLRKTAAVAATTAGPAPVHANAYELQLIALAEAKRSLKQVQSFTRKAEVKRQVLPQFSPWIAGVLEGGNGGQDDVLMTCMVWHIDVGDFDAALKIAAYALQHGLTLPDQYQRDLPTLLAEEVSNQVLAAMAAGRHVPLDALAATAQLTAERDMPDEVRAKLHKALGLAHSAAANIAGDAPSRLHAEQALHHFTRARELHPRAGVKKEIDKLQRFLHT